MATINEIKQQAATIKGATQVGENTAERVGGAIEGLADIAQQQEDKLSDLTEKENSINNILSSSNSFGCLDVVDEEGNVSLRINKEGKAIFDELVAQFIEKLKTANLPIKGEKFDVTAFISNTVSEDIEKSPSLSLFKFVYDKLNELTSSIILSNNKNFYIVDNDGNVSLNIDDKGHVMLDCSYIRNELGILKNEERKGSVIFVDEYGNIGAELEKAGAFKANFKSVKDVVTALPKYINLLSDTEYRLYYESMLVYAFAEGFKIYEYEDDFPKRDCFLVNKGKYKAGNNKQIQLYVDDLLGNNITIKSTNIRCIDKTTKGSLVVSLIGDSKSQNRCKQAEILNLCKKDKNLSVEFVGSYKHTGVDSDGISYEISNDGYGGTTILNFLDAGSSYYDSSVEGYTLPSGNKYKFSCSHAFATFEKVPNVVWIDMGANQRSSNWEDIKAAYEFIFEDIKKYNKAHSTAIKIVVSIQEGNGLRPLLNYDNGGKWYQHRNVTTLKELAAFDNREDEGIFICPQYLFVDYYNDYPMTDVPIDEYNKGMRRVSLDNIHLGINMNTFTTGTYNRGDVVNYNGKGYLSLIDNNKELPSDDKVNWAKAIDSCVNAGYYHIAKAYFTTLKYIASLTN